MYNKFKVRTVYPDRDAKLFWHFCLSQKALTKALRQRLIEDKDATVLVTGSTGSGKSTKVGKLCFNHFEHMENPRKPGEMMFSDNNFIVDPEMWAARMIQDAGNVIWVDEARDGISSKAWNSAINKTIVGRKNKNRKRGIISFILLPFEKEVDKSFLSHVTMWIWVKNRDVAEVYVANNSRKGGEGLSVQRIIEREKKWFKENPKRRVCTPIIHPEFIGLLAIGNWRKNERKRYDALVDKHHATGKLTDDEEAKFAPQLDKKQIEAMVPKALDDVEAGKVKDKRELWERLKKETSLEDEVLIRYLNRNLKIRGFKNFASFEF